MAFNVMRITFFRHAKSAAAIYRRRSRHFLLAACSGERRDDTEIDFRTDRFVEVVRPGAQCNVLDDFDDLFEVHSFDEAAAARKPAPDDAA